MLPITLVRPLLVLLPLALLLVAGSAGAQSVQGDPHDLEFNVANITTGQPGTIERLTIQYSTHVLNPVIDVRPEGSSFTIPEVPIKDVGRYIVTAWRDQVPYYWSLRGKEILAGPVALQVFDTTEDRTDLVISGMDLVLRKSDSLVQIEYNLKVANAARPQVTMVGDPVLQLDVPAGAGQFSAVLNRGPEPTDVPVTSLGSERVGLRVPLTTGDNQLRLVFRVPWQEGLTVPVGSDLPIRAWTLLAAPQNLDIQAFELEPDLDNEVPGHLHFRGPALESDRRFELRLGSRVAAGPEEDVFTTEAPAEREKATADAEEKGGRGFPVAIGGAIIVVLIIVISRRRRS